jgi:aspartate racemase
MKTIGILGGIGPESTVDYYRLMIAEYRERRPDGSYPPIILNSINLTGIVRLVEANDFAGLTGVLVRELAVLERAGAALALMAANTPHIVFDDVRRQTGLPLISIVEATRDAAKALGLRRPGLFGTRFTMQGGFYQEVFSRAGMEIVVPAPDEQDVIHHIYMDELVLGDFRPASRERLLAFAEALKAHGDGRADPRGTELPRSSARASDQRRPVRIRRIPAECRDLASPGRLLKRCRCESNAMNHPVETHVPARRWRRSISRGTVRPWRMFWFAQAPATDRQLRRSPANDSLRDEGGAAGSTRDRGPPGALRRQPRAPENGRRGFRRDALRPRFLRWNPARARRAGARGPGRDEGGLARMSDNKARALVIRPPRPGESRRCARMMAASSHGSLKRGYVESLAIVEGREREVHVALEDGQLRGFHPQYVGPYRLHPDCLRRAEREPQIGTQLLRFRRRIFENLRTSFSGVFLRFPGAGSTADSAMCGWET